MASLQDRATVLSSIGFRVLTYIFLRWIPGHVSTVTYRIFEQALIGSKGPATNHLCPIRYLRCLLHR
jgi:hypothetical protein